MFINSWTVKHMQCQLRMGTWDVSHLVSKYDGWHRVACAVIIACRVKIDDLTNPSLVNRIHKSLVEGILKNIDKPRPEKLVKDPRKLHGAELKTWLGIRARKMQYGAFLDMLSKWPGLRISWMNYPNEERESMLEKNQEYVYKKAQAEKRVQETKPEPVQPQAGPLKATMKDFVGPTGNVDWDAYYAAFGK